MRRRGEEEKEGGPSSAGGLRGESMGGGGGERRVSFSVNRLTWAWHALSTFDEVVLEALVSAHLPGRQALMV